MKIDDYLYKHLVKYFSTEDFHTFLKSRGMKKVRGKLRLLMERYVSEQLNSLSGEAKEKELLAFNDFICREIAYAHSRFTMCIPVKFNVQSSLIGAGTQNNWEDVSNLVVDNKIIDMPSTFKCQYQRKEDLTRGILVKQVYSKLIKYTRDGVEYSHVEFIYAELNSECSEVEFHFGQKFNSGINHRDSTSFSNIYSNLFELIRNEYGLDTEVSPQNRTLYLMYKDLTSRVERKVEENGKVLDGDIAKFVQSELEKIDVTSESMQNSKSKIIPRIKNQFLKVLVQKYFDNAKNNMGGNIGKVKSMQLHTLNGTTLQERSAHTTNQFDEVNMGEEGLDLELQDIYFSTKADVDDVKELFSVMIEWDVSEEIGIARKTLTVNYIAYRNYYIVHVKKVLMSREMQKYALSKIRKYEE